MLAVVAAGALVLSMSGCLGEPEPTPTPTLAFATDEEAFAAAEETYRAYVDATNARNSDPNSQPDPIDFLIGNALEGDLEGQAAIAEAGLVVRGETEVPSLAHGTRQSDGSITLVACVDVAKTRLLDSNGKDVTPPDRDDRLEIELVLQPVGDSLLIAESEAISEC